VTPDIRPTSLADLAAVDALLARSYPRLLRADYAPSVLVTALPIISKAQPDLLMSSTYFVAEIDGAIVAAGGWTQAAPGTGRGVHGVGHIRHVVSDPDHLRKGHASAVMDYVMLHAKGSGMAVLQCQSTLTAEPFYASLGFTFKGDLNIALRPGIDFPAVLMERPL
jgi:GNAT superfamily N-acetyltransferase